MSALGEHRTAGEIRLGAGLSVAALRARAVEWDLAVTEAEGLMTVQLWGGEITLGLTTAQGARLVIRAPERRLVQTIRDAVVEVLSADGVEIAWDHVETGALAPGLSLVRVVAVTERSPGFLRVRVAGPDVARFATGGLHFRLLLSPAGRAPVWPRIAANGRTQWPEGADALHRPVYTTVAQADDWLEFDIFRHAGSPTCDWAETRPIGQEVGIMGPGGGWCPEGARLALFGDETALPAISRMLVLSKGRVTAHLRVAADDLGDLAQDARVTRVPDLLAALETAAIDPGTQVWFAGQEDQARAARAFLTGKGWGKRDFTAVAYWS